MNRRVLAWGYFALFHAALIGQSRPADAIVKTMLLVGFTIAAVSSVVSFKTSK